MKLAVIGAAVLWGTAGTAGLLVAGVDPVSLAAARLVIGGLVLAIAVGPAMRSAVRPRIGMSPKTPLGAGTLQKAPPQKAPPQKAPPQEVPFQKAPLRVGVLLPAAVAVAAYQLCYFAAVTRTGVAIGTVVAIGSGPVFTGLLSWGLDRVPPPGAGRGRPRWRSSAAPYSPVERARRGRTASCSRCSADCSTPSTRSRRPGRSTREPPPTP
ncbi:DMT family transporter [Streptosporangium lutulentum]